MNNSPDFYRLYKSFGLILNNATSSKEIIDEIENVIQNNEQQLDCLFRQNKISKSFYEISKIYLEIEIFGFSYSNLNLFLDLSTVTPSIVKLDIEEINKTTQVLDSKYNIFMISIIILKLILNIITS